MITFSFRSKMALTIAASVLAVVFTVFVIGSYYINVLQKRNVQQAEKLAKEQVHELSNEIAAMMKNRNIEDLDDPAIRETMNAKTKVILRQNKVVVWAAVVDKEGDKVIVHSTPGEQIVKRIEPDGIPQTSTIPSGGKDDLEITVESEAGKYREIKETITRDGHAEGEIRLRLTETPTFQQIETTSRQISGFLMAGCLLLLGFFLIVFYALWRLFTRQVELLQRNARLDRMAYVGTLASGLAHEIRNPLSAMNVNLEVMKEELTDTQGGNPAHAVDLAGRLQKEVVQLNSTLTSFLDFALPSKEGFTDFSIRSLLEELIHYHCEQMKHAGITIDFQGPPAEECVISADRRLIHQAFRNIFLNATQVLASSVKKQIRVKLEKLPNQHFRIAISDTGPGIKAENMSRIFDVFFSTRKGGSGFGLAITKKIVEEHGGNISAENNADSLGATFIIELPRIAKDPLTVLEERHGQALSLRKRRSIG